MSNGRTSWLRRDPANAMLGGVCAGLARSLGVDPIITRVGFVVVTIGTSGIAAVAYLLAWALIPAATAGPATRERPRRRRGSWRIATGVGLLALSVLLAFRELGIWWSDALVWPLTLAAFGVALLWSLSRPRPEPEDGGAELATAAAPETAAELGRDRAGRLSRAGFGIALIVGAALLFLWASGVLDAAGDVALAALVVTLALVLISAPSGGGCCGA